MLNKKKVIEITTKLNVMLKEFAKKNNMSFDEMPKVKYSETGIIVDNVKLQLTDDGSKKAIEEKKEMDFKMKAINIGLIPEDYERIVVIEGREVKLVEINTRSYKYPLVFETTDGKKERFKGTVRLFLSKIGR